MNILKLHDPNAQPTYAPALQVAQFGLEVIEQYSETLDQPVMMQMRPMRALSWSDYENAFKGMLSIEQGIRWLVGDLMAMGERLYPDRFEQAAPVLGSSVKTLQNWQSVSKSIPALGLTANVNEYADRVHRGEFILPGGEHIGNLRHAGIDWTWHQKLQRLQKDKDLLDIRAIVMTTALKENFTSGSDIDGLRELLENQYKAKGSQAVIDYLDSKRNYQGIGFDRTIERLDFTIPKGASVEFVESELRTLAARLQAHAESGDVLVKTKAVK